MAKNYFFPLKKSKILRKISRSGRSSSHLDLRNILSVRPHPPYEKNKLLLNEYLGDFMHFETIFFLRKMTFSNPPTPLKCGKFHTFFLNRSLEFVHNRIILGLKKCNQKKNEFTLCCMYIFDCIIRYQQLNIYMFVERVIIYILYIVIYIHNVF